MATEFELIAELTDGLVLGPGVRLGPGDDAAVLAPRGDIVITTDVLIEDVHFKRSWSPAFQVGRKAVAVNISDVEAMGAEPSAVVIGLAFPRNLERRWISDFQEGVVEECARAGASLVGGDLSSSPHIALGVTAVGNLSGRPAATRAGAKIGDQVAVCGRLGCSAGGLLVLQRGFGSPKDLVLEHQCPTVAYGQGKVAAEAGVTAMIDVSDGLLQDLGHICELSGVGIDVRTEDLEVHDSLARLAAATGKDPLEFVMTGGEDHALAGTFPTGAQLPPGWWRIGEVKPGAGVTVDGMPWTGGRGWDHFA